MPGDAELRFQILADVNESEHELHLWYYLYLRHIYIWEGHQLSYQSQLQCIKKHLEDQINIHS